VKYAAAGLLMLALSACTTGRVELADIAPAAAPAPAATAARPTPAVIAGNAAPSAMAASFAPSATDTAEAPLELAYTPPPRPALPDSKLITAALPFADSHPHPFTGIVPADYPIHGVDISKYQGNIDWAKLKAHGISFVYIKATEGGDHTDERFRDHWRAAAQNGIPHGAYHFYYFCRRPLEQARWFERHVPNDPSALPPVLDIEWNPDSRTCSRRPSPATVRREMTTFLNAIERHYGKRPVIYTTPDFFRDNLVGAFPHHEFWLRSVAGHPSAVYPEARRWRFWQYTGTGVVPGIRGKTDINAFAGNDADWRTWLANNRVRMD
jgi:lysozyme